MEIVQKQNALIGVFLKNFIRILFSFSIINVNCCILNVIKEHKIILILHTTISNRLAILFFLFCFQLNYSFFLFFLFGFFFLLLFNDVNILFNCIRIKHFQWFTTFHNSNFKILLSRLCNFK